MNQTLIPIFQASEQTSLKERLLWPFAKRYRNRIELTKFPVALRLIANEVLVFPEHKLLLVKNSKAGCTSASNMLYQCFFGEKFDGDIHRTDIGLIQGRNHLRAIRTALSDPDVFKITTVRHPVTRAVSGFTDFFIDQKNQRTSAHLKSIKHFGFDDAKSDDDNFNSYLDMLEYSFSLDPLRIDRHFRLQTVNTAIAAIKFNSICRVENLGPDLVKALMSSGVAPDAVKGLDSDVRNASRAKGFVPNTDQLRKIEILYRIDLEAFGYDLNNF